MNTQTTTAAGLDADERKQLVDSVRRFAERDYGFEARMRALRHEGGFSPGHWRTLPATLRVSPPSRMRATCMVRVEPPETMPPLPSHWSRR